MAAASAPAPDAGIQLRTSPTVSPAPRGEAGKALPIILRAREVRGRPDFDNCAEGDAVLRRGDLVIRADRLSYDQVDDLARALGNVRINQGGNVYTGPEVQLRLERFEGFFQSPTYFLGRTRAGGKADRIDFIDDQRAVATNATYHSCRLDGAGTPGGGASA